jgi:heme exporter protein B
VTGFWRASGVIALRDLRVEVRSGEAISVVFPFALVATWVVPLATNASSALLRDLAAPVYWLVTLLFGMLIVFRQTALETSTQRRSLALAGLDPAARFAGRSMASATILTPIALALVVPIVVLYDYRPPHGIWLMMPVITMAAMGLAMLGTLAGDVTVGLRARTSLAPLLMAPLAVPLLMGASQALESLIAERSIITWVLVLVIADLGLAAAGVMSARALEEIAL